MKHTLTQIIVLLFIWLSFTPAVLAQVNPVQNQAYFNPYIYNPAWAGHSGFRQLFVGVKTQWLNVDGAPTMATATFDMPVSDGLSMAGQIINIHQGPFNRLMTQAGASYKVTLQEKRFLSFGLSVGFDHLNFNAQALDDPNDPAVASVAINEINLTGSAGLAYTHDNWKAGLSLPNLLAPTSVVEPDQNHQPWDYLIGSVSYTYQYSTDWKITPTIFYHHYGNFADQIEGGLKLDYRSKIWAGGLFRQDYGATAFLGIDISKMFNVNYLYSFSSVSANLPNDSHEIVLGVKFGKKQQ